MEVHQICTVIGHKAADGGWNLEGGSWGWGSCLPDQMIGLGGGWLLVAGAVGGAFRRLKL